MPTKNPENPRVFLVHGETVLGEFVLIAPLRFQLPLGFTLFASIAAKKRRQSRSAC